MFRFLLFAANCLIFVAAENDFMFCRQTGSDTGPNMKDVTIENVKEICPQGFQQSTGGAEGGASCYRYAPANSIDYETFTKQCKCLHGYPGPVKDKRVRLRYKRHFRGFRPQVFRQQSFQPQRSPPQVHAAAGQLRSKPYFGAFSGQQQSLEDYQKSAINHPVLDIHTFQCQRWFDCGQQQSLEDYQKSAINHPVLDIHTFQCQRWFDWCVKIPKQSDNQCPPGFIWYSTNQDCYKFHSPQTWHEAEKICNSENSHLSSVRLTQELNFLAGR
uniref:C-type lectin domain-containing protein n=1 Tax=Panagrolaimus sp. PS1159 TaxID=55785 RepID=A0AC35GSX1_9BILA